MNLPNRKSFLSPDYEKKHHTKLFVVYHLVNFIVMKLFKWVIIDLYPVNTLLRLVSVLWGSTWYNYLTNVLDPQILSAQQVCELYRRRWRIEDAFLLTKRLLGLAEIWVGDSNGVQIQILATWIFYAVLNQLCIDVAIALNQPLDLISTEMVFRSLYHFSRAVLRGECDDVVSYRNCSL